MGLLLFADERTYSISLWNLATWVTWLMAATLICFGVVVHDDLTQIGLGLTTAGATLSIRGFCCRLGRDIQNAFEVGRDVGRAETEAVIRSLR